MNRILAGFTGGFVATAVLSVLMVAKGMMGIMPGLDVIHMLSEMMAAPAAVGWLAHFMIGTVAWGGAFAVFFGLIPGGSPMSKGIVFGIAAWLGMMVMIMPMAGAGIFGMAFGLMAPMMTLILHVVFGAVMGVVFNAVSEPSIAVQ